MQLNNRTVHLLIKGKVQGVYYRVSAKKIAEEYGITGWIKNTKEGDVEAVAGGSNEAVTNFIEWCKKGPRNASVTDVIITDMAIESHETFIIKR